MRFAGEWRDYQARVLGEIDAHLDDDRLHVVAAPGSGKTVLGLEAMRRIGRPALVLSPSLAIRNQWAERLCPLFLPDLGPHRHLLSRDLAAPADLTLATYQALHAAHLTFEHPVTGAIMAFDSPLPADLHAVEAALAALGAVPDHGRSWSIMIGQDTAHENSS